MQGQGRRCGGPDPSHPCLGASLRLLSPPTRANRRANDPSRPGDESHQRSPCAGFAGRAAAQRSLNQPRVVDQYFADYPRLAPLLDRVGAFEIFATPWFAAIYLLLMISLIGCLTPRSLEYLRAMRQKPVATPRNLARMPHHAEGVVDGTPDEVLGRSAPC
ncbi:cytochrome c biogenesis protein ResB [Pseudonocardia sp. RS010]|uniref:cytochrome c biogenesis protein ResB n=1 Tax=Pseudonocardia sp. RS010 TaxID=3385979 RepID=UPI00399F556F